jgi:two-component system alkaline phosphatase synthesis response regulator PhoP
LGVYAFRRISACIGAVAGFLATVLICEDEPALRELIRVSLNGRYEFAEAEDGVLCLELARELRPDIIILDVMLPGRNGIDVLRELRQDSELSGTPVLVLTAQPETRDDALREGANRVMDKPFDPDDISVAVEEVLAAPT